MVYSTRSRSVTASKPAAATARALGETKTAPKKKRSTHQATKGRKKVPVTKPTRPLKTTVTTSLAPRRTRTTIDPADLHKHIKDGKDHHVTEQDGLDHHHIWYEEFGKNTPRTRTTIDPADHHKHIKDGKDHHLTEQDGLDHHHIWYKDFGESTLRRPSITIDIADNHHKHLKDGKDHHIVEQDGRDHHHIWYQDFSENEDNGLRHRQQQQLAPSIEGNSASRNARRSSQTGSSQSKTVATRVEFPLEIKVDHSHRKHLLDGKDHHTVEKDGLDHHHIRYAAEDETATGGHHQGATKAARKTSVAHTETSKSRTPIHKADSSVVTDQGRTTRSRRYQGSDIAATSTTSTSHVLPAEFHGDLKHEKQSEKKVERQSQHMAKDLEAALAQRDKLAAQVKEMSEKLRSREMELRHSQTAVRGLEKTNAAKVKETQKLSGELGALKKEMSSREKELKHCHAQIKKLEGSHEQFTALQGQLQGLRSKLAERESSLKALQKANKSLVHDSERAEELQEEVKDLQHDIHIREDQLKIAKRAVDDLAGFRDQATTLEVEVISLRDQLEAEEKHETDLEDALMKHENCAFKQQQMQDQIKLLQYELREKEKEVTSVHSTDDAEIHQRDAMANALHAEISKLQKELADKEGVAQKLKEKSDTEITKLHSNVGTLKIEVLGLRQQLKDKNTELKASEKTAKDLEKKAQDYLARTSKAEKEAKGLKTEIKELEHRLATLQGQLVAKESTLTRTEEASHKDHDVAEHRLVDMRSLIADLRKQTKQEMKAKDDQIAALKKQVYTWESHEEGWTDTLNKEIEREKMMLHEKEKTLSEATHEIGRLNVVVNQTRTELAQDRKRRASEIEESSKAQQQQAQKLNQQIHSLADANEHLEKRVHLEHEHAVQGEELTNQVQELLQWQQTANAQRKEWEATVKRLEGEKEKHTARLAQSEKSIQELQGQLAEAGQWRQKALEQAEKLNGMVSKLEKDQKMLKDLVSKGDKSEIKMKEKESSLEAHIQSLDNDKLRLAQEITIKETLIEELQQRLEDEMAKLGTRLQESKASVSHLNKDLLSKESQIQKMTKGQAALEARTQELQRCQEHDHHQLEKEHQVLLQERALAAEEKRKDEEVIATLRRASRKMEQEYSAMETKLKKEMSMTQDLTDKLATLRKSITKDSQAELKKLDELENDIKTRSSAVKETTQVTRNRLDSGAFLETSSTTTGEIPDKYEYDDSVIVLDEPLVSKAVENYFVTNDPYFKKEVWKCMVKSTALGQCAFERFMMKVFSEMLNRSLYQSSRINSSLINVQLSSAAWKLLAGGNLHSSKTRLTQ
ncbi:hypothetical protein BGZ92_006040 [Podila epicladia]|nr:hypothetical protein BGZ92_006040 [Podila epicladia]